MIVTNFVNLFSLNTGTGQSRSLSFCTSRAPAKWAAPAPQQTPLSPPPSLTSGRGYYPMLSNVIIALLPKLHCVLLLSRTRQTNMFSAVIFLSRFRRRASGDWANTTRRNLFRLVYLPLLLLCIIIFLMLL